MSDEGQDADPSVYCIRTDEAGVVMAAVRSNVAQPGMTEVGEAAFDAAKDSVGRCRWDGAAIQPYAPPASPAPPRQQLGGTFLGAVADLGWWSWMEQGAAAQVAAGKPLDGRYWQAIGKADIVLGSDAKLNRVAAAAERARVAASGQPAPAAPVITMAAAMDHGDAMVAPAPPTQA